MSDLRPADFDAYFHAVHESEPFPWQRRLLEVVAADGKWPCLLDLPTGTGKTAAIDVALFHLALDPQRAPRRIVLVVDRRTVVDQAFRRAEHIQCKLRHAQDGILRIVRNRLGLDADDSDASIECVQMRGGMPRDDAWAERPDRPVVAVSTVDQVGSRLLFRGYGISDRMRPIHAGLLGHDTLFLLDEVHLARPFQETLEAVRRYRARGSQPMPDRWQFVAMSATPSQTEGVFRLAPEDRSDPRLSPRLERKKLVTTEAVKGSQFVATVARHARSDPAARRVAIIVNRVATALDIHRQTDAVLVTGRMRPLDRRAREEELQRRVASGSSRSPKNPPVLVVATQCIEAGADFDFDRVITECASLDALRQRFGRLNRIGELQEAAGVVVARAEDVKEGASDVVYGEALRETWRWMGPSRDFGIAAMESAVPQGEALAKMLPPQSHAPVMLPSHLDRWVQTSPIPRPDPDVSLWLHGIDRRSDTDVQIVWRADLSEGALVTARDDNELLERILNRINVCPPSGLEALAVPFASARAWLAGTTPPMVSDVEGALLEDEDGDHDRAERVAVLWKGDDSRLIDAKDLRPGMTVVVPTAYGGLTSWNWDPLSNSPVDRDHGDQARWEQKGRATLRLHPGVVPPNWSCPDVGDPDEVDDDTRASVGEWLEALTLNEDDEPWRIKAIKALRTGRDKTRRYDIVRLESLGSEEPADVAYLALVQKGRGDVSTEDDASSLTGVEIPLHAHMKGVAEWAERFGKACFLPDAIVRDLELAGRWHDAGKVDPRFQRMLRAGSSWASEGLEPLAKSAMSPSDRALRKRARERSGYPRGGRHELSSVSLVEKEASLLDGATDRDLVLHLIASHHGWCRPFAPVVDDPEPVELSLEIENGKVVTVSSRHELEALHSGVADRFWRLVERYGWYGLAWFEAILRLADHRRSEQEQKQKDELEVPR